MEDLAVIVLDCGSGFTKLGFAGDDSPRSIFPTVTGHLSSNESGHKSQFFGAEALLKRNMLSLNYPVERGIVNNWDDMEQIWQHGFYSQLRAAPEERAMVLLEPPLNPNPHREKMLQIMVETFNVPAIYLANQATMALYASGRTTGVVLNSGDGVTHIVPIYEGHALPHFTARLDFGGQDVTECTVRIMEEHGYAFVTAFERAMVRDIKEKLGYVALDYETDLQIFANSSRLERSYDFPGGSVICIQNERFRAPEVLFKPYLLGLETPGIHEHINSVISKCHIDIQRELYKNIVLSGGNTLFSGITDRLQKELTALAPPDAKIYLIAPPERKYSPFIGGSMLGSQPDFERLCISKEEYEEFGTKIVHRKCF